MSVHSNASHSHLWILLFSQRNPLEDWKGELKVVNGNSLAKQTGTAEKTNFAGDDRGFRYLRGTACADGRSGERPVASADSLCAQNLPETKKDVAKKRGQPGNVFP